jgi:hypothetical protein
MLRKDVQKKDMQQNNTKVLDEIISSQRPYYDRSKLGYNQIQIEKDSSSKMTEQEAKPSSYAKSIIGPPKKEEEKNIQEEDYIDTAPPRRFRSQYQQQPVVEIPQ